jgi:hypothetical protein
LDEFLVRAYSIKSLNAIFNVAIRQANSLFFGVNFTLMLMGSGVLLVASHLWLGTKEDFEVLVRYSYWHFFGMRLLFNMIVGALIVGFIGIVNLVFNMFKRQKINQAKILLFHFIIFTACSVAFTFLALK